MVTDAQSGDVYYQNDETGESSWEFPTTQEHASDASKDGTASLTVDEVVPVSTVEATNVALPAENMTIEEETNETSVALEDTASTSVKLPDGWYVATDEASGAKYYQNDVIGESSWEIPNVSTEAAPNDMEDAVRPNPIDELPAGWHAVLDEESGATYYQNEQGESSWEFPISA